MEGSGVLFWKQFLHLKGIERERMKEEGDVESKFL